MATHYVARELTALGHGVKQVPPAYAKPFRQGHKNDYRDAHAVAEAVQRPTTRFVPAKTNEQLGLQALHRVRSRLVSERTAVINQIRGFLLERGIIVRQGHRFLRHLLPDILAKRTDVLSPRMIRKTHYLQIITFGLQRAAGPYRWATRVGSLPTHPL
jgi:transposase